MMKCFIAYRRKSDLQSIIQRGEQEMLKTPIARGVALAMPKRLALHKPAILLVNEISYTSKHRSVRMTPYDLLDATR